MLYQPYKFKIFQTQFIWVLWLYIHNHQLLKRHNSNSFWYTDHTHSRHFETVVFTPIIYEYEYTVYPVCTYNVTSRYISQQCVNFRSNRSISFV